jgi:hypothetical protein
MRRERVLREDAAGILANRLASAGKVSQNMIG